MITPCKQIYCSSTCPPGKPPTPPRPNTSQPPPPGKNDSLAHGHEPPPPPITPPPPPPKDSHASFDSPSRDFSCMPVSRHEPPPRPVTPPPPPPSKEEHLALEPYKARLSCERGGDNDLLGSSLGPGERLYASRTTAVVPREAGPPRPVPPQPHPDPVNPPVRPCGASGLCIDVNEQECGCELDAHSELDGVSMPLPGKPPVPPRPNTPPPPPPSKGDHANDGHEPPPVPTTPPPDPPKDYDGLLPIPFERVYAYKANTWGCPAPPGRSDPPIVPSLPLPTGYNLLYQHCALELGNGGKPNTPGRPNQPVVGPPGGRNRSGHPYAFGSGREQCFRSLPLAAKGTRLVMAHSPAWLLAAC